MVLEPCVTIGSNPLLYNSPFHPLKERGLALVIAVISEQAVKLSSRGTDSESALVKFFASINTGVAWLPRPCKPTTLFSGRFREPPRFSILCRIITSKPLATRMMLSLALSRAFRREFSSEIDGSVASANAEELELLVAAVSAILINKSLKVLTGDMFIFKTI